MLIKEGKQTEYENVKEINSHDGYSLGVITFLERWSDLMEEDIEKTGNAEQSIICNAKCLSFKADTEGITGFMYGAAVHILSQYWKYGDILRKWHNKEYDYTGEGVANPAMLIISSK